MHEHNFSAEEIDDLILKYADEKFGIQDAIRFEAIIRCHPELFVDAQTNRSVRKALRRLPSVKAAVGFEQRLSARIGRI